MEEPLANTWSKNFGPSNPCPNIISSRTVIAKHREHFKKPIPFRKQTFQRIFILADTIYFGRHHLFWQTPRAMRHHMSEPPLAKIGGRKHACSESTLDCRFLPFLNLSLCVFFPVSISHSFAAVVTFTTVLLVVLSPQEPQTLKAADGPYQHGPYQHGPYQHGPESMFNSDNPRGTLTEHMLSDSKVFPGTRRHYSFYVPAQYSPKRPAALMAFQDGHTFLGKQGDFRVPIVFDNLIAKGVMPVTIAVMIDPGHKDELPEKRGWKPRPANRSVEYDTVSGDYAKFLLEEFLPPIESDYRITQNPELRAIYGNSSGGICAFSVAWHRPDQFCKVLSHIGCFVDLRGGHNYPPMIRKTQKRRFRVLLQDGKNDLDNRFGNWPLAKRQMARSLSYQNYDYKLVFGVGGHNGKDDGTIFPDSLQWLWQAGSS